MTPGAIRSLALGLLFALLLGAAAIAAGLRYNGTRSYPVGLYLACHKSPQRGDLVLVNLPSLPIFQLARERGYLNVAYSPVGRILKRIVAADTDIISISAAGVEVNGALLTNSIPLPHDGSGRPLHFYPLRDYILGPSEVLLMSDYNPASFDSRYFGVLTTTTIDSVVRPLLTF